MHRPVELLDDERAFEQERRHSEEARLVALWIGETTGHAALQRQAASGGSLDELRAALLSGEVLCELVNVAAARGAKDEGAKLEGVPIQTYSRDASSKFRCMENVSRFIAACRDFFQVPEHQLFCTTDLSENRNMLAVVRCIHALGGRIQALYPSYSGPRLGIPDNRRFSPRPSGADAAAGGGPALPLWRSHLPR